MSDEQSTREQFIAAYLTLPGTTEEMGGEVYDLLSKPAGVEFFSAVIDVCDRVALAGPDEEGT